MRTANLSKHLNGLFGFIFVICLLPLFPTVAEGQTLNLTGTWNFNSFVSGPSAPWWERGTLTVTQNGTFSGSGTESNGNTDSPAGTFSISSNGIVMTLNDQSATLLCQVDTSNTFASCTETLSDGSSYLLIMTQQTTSSTLADLAGTWEGNVLFSGPTPLWERVSETINSDGTFTGTYAKSDGTTGTISGALSITPEGEISCLSGSCVDPTYVSFLNKDDTIMVGTNGAETSADDAGLFVFTKQTTSYSLSKLVATWQGNGLASGPGAPWWENDTLVIKQNGTCSFTWTASDGSTGSENGTVSISSAGVITLNLGTTAVGVIDANMTVMVFTNTWADGATQEIKVFTNGTPAVPVTAPIIGPSTGTTPATTATTPATAGVTQPTAGSTAPSSNTGAPTAGNTALSNTGGGATAQGGGSTATGSGPSEGSANAPVMATNAPETGPAPLSPSKGAAPSTVPEAPEMVVANPGYSEASVSFKLPANGRDQITGCTVTSNPDGLTATGAGSPITVSNLSNGTAYKFTVTASNKVGTGPPSDASNSVTPAAVPDAPAILTAEAGNSEAKVSFKAPASDGGSKITSYTVTSSSGRKASGPISPITVKGLTNGRPCTFTVTAANKIGTGRPSGASNSVTPATVPGAPAIVRVRVHNSEAQVSFKVPGSNGGSKITSYTVTSSSGQTASGPASPITVKGLINGTSCRFTVTAANKIGVGPPSRTSKSVTPR